MTAGAISTSTGAGWKFFGEKVSTSLSESEYNHKLLYSIDDLGVPAQTGISFRYGYNPRYILKMELPDAEHWGGAFHGCHDVTQTSTVTSSATSTQTTTISSS